MFYFQIRDADDQHAVREDLGGLEPELLLFLRKIQVVEVRLETSNGDCEKNFKLSRQDTTHMGLAIVTVTRTNLDTDANVRKVSKFVMHKNTVHYMPPEPRRQDITSSDVVLAFLVNKNYDPDISDCLVFNFLPIRAYGIPVRLFGMTAPNKLS